jgi:hypothetical protein
MQVMTCCNTGSLATSGYGTALGVVRALHADGKLEHVFATETRPYNQVHTVILTRGLSAAACGCELVRVSRWWVSERCRARG